MKPISSFLYTALLFVSLAACNAGEKKEPAATKPLTAPGTDTLLKKNPSASLNSYVAVDVSPMDMCYFPVDYPKLKMVGQADPLPLARVIYSRPHLQGRQLFEAILKYGEPWRLGANEATELQLFKAAAINDKKIPAGRYILYCIPERDKWTIVLNSNIDCWGLKQDASKDVARIDVPAKKTIQRIEYFTMLFEKTDSGTDLLMAWDDTEVRLPFSF